jgi:hypothetical protein
MLPLVYTSHRRSRVRRAVIVLTDRTQRQHVRFQGTTTAAELCLWRSGMYDSCTRNTAHDMRSIMPAGLFKLITRMLTQSVLVKLLTPESYCSSSGEHCVNRNYLCCCRCNDKTKLLLTTS